MRSALEKTILTEMGGELYEDNSFSDDDKPINIFTPIRNKNVKRKFRSTVNRTKTLLGMFKRTNYGSNKKHRGSTMLHPTNVKIPYKTKHRNPN